MAFRLSEAWLGSVTSFLPAARRGALRHEVKQHLAEAAGIAEHVRFRPQVGYQGTCERAV
jgi:hypothetical protein